MGAPIRTTIEVQFVLNKAQHALADLGVEIVREKKRGKTITNRDHRDKVYRLLLLRIYLQDILLPDGGILAYYLTSANEKKFNKILDGLVNLAKGFDGPAIPLLGVKNIPLLFYPGTSGASSTAGGGPAIPGGTTFQATVNTPSALVDTFDASLSSFGFYIISISGSGSGEGSRTSIMSATWRGSSTPAYTETKTEDVGGITTPLTLKVELVAGKIQLNAYTSTNAWTITGVRILFQNISFVNPIGPLPAGGTLNQLLRKSSSLDYQTQWFTLIAAAITDLTVSSTEINKLLASDSTTTKRKYKEIQIGNWNMAVSLSVTVAHGITKWQTVRVLDVTIFKDDASADNMQLNSFHSGALQGGTDGINAGGIRLNILSGGSGGYFPTSGFYTSSAVNRGMVTISYEE